MDLWGGGLHIYTYLYRGLQAYRGLSEWEAGGPSDTEYVGIMGAAIGDFKGIILRI